MFYIGIEQDRNTHIEDLSLVVETTRTSSPCLIIPHFSNVDARVVPYDNPVKKDALLFLIGLFPPLQNPEVGDHRCQQLIPKPRVEKWDYG